MERIATPNIPGTKGLRAGEVIAKSLVRYYGEVVIVHHMWNEKDKFILQLERRNVLHNLVKFERLVL